MPKTKLYYISHTIYVSVDIEAKNEEEAEEKFDDMIRKEKKYVSLILASESVTEVTEA